MVRPGEGRLRREHGSVARAEGDHARDLSRGVGGGSSPGTHGGRHPTRTRHRRDPRRRPARPGSPRWRKLRWYVPARSGRSEGAANVAKVTMPQLGESVAEGTIGKWLKQPGDTVAKYEPLLEVITDKVNAEVPSPFEGVLKEILAEEGATVPNNAEIAIIETADEAGGDAPASAALEKQGGPEAEGTTQV